MVVTSLLWGLMIGDRGVTTLLTAKLVWDLCVLPSRSIYTCLRRSREVLLTLVYSKGEILDPDNLIWSNISYFSTCLFRTCLEYSQSKQTSHSSAESRMSLCLWSVHVQCIVYWASSNQSSRLASMAHPVNLRVLLEPFVPFFVDFFFCAGCAVPDTIQPL
jgi:hypothetical protein